MSQRRSAQETRTLLFEAASRILRAGGLNHLTLAAVAREAGLSIRHRLLIVLATSAARRSSYCVFAWGSKFTTELDPVTAAAVVRGETDIDRLDPAETALVQWARLVAAAPHHTTRFDVERLRDTGWTDRQIFAATTFAALRVAFASVNDALGAAPYAQLAGTTPAQLRDAVDFGRPLE